MDLEVDHYSTDDLLDLLNINVNTREAVLQATDIVLQRYKKNKDYVKFFTQVRERLLADVHPLEDPINVTYESDVKRGTINPDLKNTVTRFINIDSSCRVLIDQDNLSSDSFGFELTETLTNVISMSLYSVEIPQSWFNNTSSKGTISGVLCYTKVATETTTTRIPFTIPEGNYSTMGLPTAVAFAIQTAIQSDPTAALVTCSSSISSNTGLATLCLNDLPNETDIIQVMWFDESYSTEVLLNSRYNANLGWMLGFRSPITTFKSGKASALSPVDSNGTKYIIMSLNDYKTNRINRSLLSVNTFPTIPIQTPSYFNASVPQVRISPTQVNALMSNPRQLTEKQLYTINAIASQQTTNRRFTTRVGSDTFAKIPLKKTDWNKCDESGNMTLIDNAPAKLFVDGGGPLQLQMREYFGPVDITQLEISLCDDRGNSLGLNGMDWSCTLMVKCIYQY